MTTYPIAPPRPFRCVFCGNGCPGLPVISTGPRIPAHAACLRKGQRWARVLDLIREMADAEKSVARCAGD